MHFHSTISIWSRIHSYNLNWLGKCVAHTLKVDNLLCFVNIQANRNALFTFNCPRVMQTAHCSYWEFTIANWSRITIIIQQFLTYKPPSHWITPEKWHIIAVYWITTRKLNKNRARTKLVAICFICESRMFLFLDKLNKCTDKRKIKKKVHCENSWCLIVWQCFNQNVSFVWIFSMDIFFFLHIWIFFFVYMLNCIVE